jgi:hypothetical protein
MQSGVTKTRPSGASLAVLQRNKPAPASGTTDSPAERIRHAEEVLRNLLLEDDFDDERNILCGNVCDELSQILLQLSNVAGKQELFELWIAK